MCDRRRTVLIAFDFDGTLYPLRPYDSEQRLLMKAVENRSTQERTEAMQAVRNDMEGLLSLGEFTENVCTIHATRSGAPAR
jgi:phosphoserine phosphatase